VLGVFLCGQHSQLQREPCERVTAAARSKRRACCRRRKQQRHRACGQALLSLTARLLARAAGPQKLERAGWEKSFFPSELTVAWEGRCPPRSRRAVGRAGTALTGLGEDEGGQHPPSGRLHPGTCCALPGCAHSVPAGCSSNAGRVVPRAVPSRDRLCRSSARAPSPVVSPRGGGLVCRGSRAGRVGGG